MRDNPKEPTLAFQDWFAGGDIFYRSQDKQRFQGALSAIVEDGLGLAVIGANETVLDHYRRMLVARLRELNNFQLEIFLPANTDSLLKRFNEMLTTMTMQQARQPAVATTPVKVLLVNDAKAVDRGQWKLLVRLLADFPGVNVRPVLFLDRTGLSDYENLLTMFGRKLYRWLVETPTLDEASQLMQAAKEHGFAQETQTLLIQTGLGAALTDFSLHEEHNKGDFLTAEDNDQAIWPDTATGLLQQHESSPDDNCSSQRRKISSLGDFWSVAALFVVSLSITWLVAMSFNSDLLETDSTPVVEEIAVLSSSVDERKKSATIESTNK